MLLVLNRSRVTSVGPYVIVGLIIWVCTGKSGIHATLAGVITALAVPIPDGKGGSPLGRAEQALHPWVAYGILPVFAFANAGVSLSGHHVVHADPNGALGDCCRFGGGQNGGGVWRIMAVDTLWWRAVALSKHLAAIFGCVCCAVWASP